MNKIIKNKDLINLAKNIFKDTEKEARQLTINNIDVGKRDDVTIIKHIRKIGIGEYKLEKIQVGNLIINIKENGNT